MSHLDERIAEFVFGEMEASETATATAHLSQCSECARQVAEFRLTHAMLKASPDADLPRPVVFEVEKRTAPPWLWRWLPPLASAVAASVVTALLLTPTSPPLPSEQPVYEEVISELQTLRGQVVLLEKLRSLDRHDVVETTAKVGQLLAQKSPSEE